MSRGSPSEHRRSDRRSRRGSAAGSFSENLCQRLPTALSGHAPSRCRYGPRPLQALASIRNDQVGQKPLTLESGPAGERNARRRGQGESDCFTSHSHGPGSVSSKSLRSNSNCRSGDANEGRTRITALIPLTMCRPADHPATACVTLQLLEGARGITDHRRRARRPSERDELPGAIDRRLGSGSPTVVARQNSTLVRTAM